MITPTMTDPVPSIQVGIAEGVAGLGDASTSTFSDEKPPKRRLGQLCKSCGKRRTGFPVDKYGRPKTKMCFVCTGDQPDPDARHCECGAVLAPSKRKCTACLTPAPRLCSTVETITGPFPVRRSDGTIGVWNAAPETVTEIRCKNPAAPKAARCDECRMKDDPASSQCPFCGEWYITHNSSRYASQSEEHRVLQHHAQARCTPNRSTPQNTIREAAA